MVIFAYPDTLFNLSVERFGVYVSNFMKRLITNPRHRRGLDGKYHHHEEPCSRMQQYITYYVPPDSASYITPRLMRHVNLCYNELIIGRFNIPCEEIAPYVLKSVIRTSLKCLDVLRNEAHPTLLDYYKDIDSDLIYRTLPLLRGFKTLRLGNVMGRVNEFLDVEGFRNTLEEFACPLISFSDFARVADNCKYVKRIDIGGPLNFLSQAFGYISAFKYIEDLNVNLVYDLSEKDLDGILLWLAGILSFDEERSEDAGSARTRAAHTSGGSRMYSVAEGSRTYPARNLGLLKSFGCFNARYKQINLISQFYNLTSLVLVNEEPSPSLAPLGNLKLLKNLTLEGYVFSHTQEVLKSIGNQLKCLNLKGVENTDLSFVSQNCGTLECLHIRFPFTSHALSSGKSNHEKPGSVPAAEFPHVLALQLYFCPITVWQYIVSNFPNLRKLSLPFPRDLLLLQKEIQERRLTRLEEFYWGKNTVVHFNGRIAMRAEFYCDGEMIVENYMDVNVSLL